MRLKEKIKENEKVKFIIEVWNNKRYRSILLLCLYFVFFIVIINVIRGNYSESRDNQSSKKVTTNSLNEVTNNPSIQNSINSMISAGYTYKLSTMTLEYPEINITGLYQKNSEEISYNNTIYNIINNNLYLANEDNLIKVSDDGRPFDIPIEQLSLINVKDYVLDGGEVAQKEIDDNTKLIEYIIPIDNIECNILITYSKEDVISLSTVYNNINIEITYKKVGDV